MIGYNIVDNALFKFRAMAGPVGVHADLGKTDLNTIMWNIQAGLGIDLWKITLDVRYEFGLNELNKGATEQTKSNSYMVSLGLKF